MSKRDGKIAYLVVCWNNAEIISRCLDSINNQTYKNAVTYVIDNDSTDNTAQIIEENYPDVLLTKSDENNGFAKGNNILIRKALQDPDIAYIALINSDAVLDKNWGKELVEYLENKPHFACAQGITLDYFDHSIVDAEHVYVGSNFQSVQYGYGEKFKKAFAYPRKVFGVNAAAAVYSRTYVDNQGGDFFDEKFYMYLEDVDISFRAVLTGWSNYYVPSAVAYHMGSVSAKKRSNAYNIYMTFRNQSALLVKNMPLKTFFSCLPEALKFEIFFYRHLKKSMGSQTMWLALKGRFIGIFRSPLYLGDRWHNMKNRKISSQDLLRLLKRKGIY